MPAVGSQLHVGFPSSSSVSLGQPTWSCGIQNQQSFNRPTNSPRMPYRPQQCTPAAGSTQGPRAQSHSGKWNFRSVGQSTSGMWAKEKMDTSRVQTTPQKQVRVTLQVEFVFLQLLIQLRDHTVTCQSSIFFGYYQKWKKQDYRCISLNGQTCYTFWTHTFWS